jgi:hypothetical protein
MKKVLLGSSALVAASMLASVPVAAAEAPTLSFSGLTRVEVSGVDQDLTAGLGSGYQFETDSHSFGWRAGGTADNGMTYSANIATSTSAAGDLTIGEAKLTFVNSWGTVIVGDDDGADDAMMYGGFSLLTAGFGHDGGFSSNVQRGGLAGNQAAASLEGDTGDATKASYYTPRMNGLQIGASFTPDAGANFSTGIADDNDGDNYNHLGLGVNYIGTVGDVGIKLAATTAQASTEPNSTSASATSSLARDAISSWSVGGILSFSGFSVGMGHGDNGDSACTKANTLCDQGTWWDLVGQYAWGATKASMGYLEVESNVAGVAVGDDVNIWSMGIQHDFASAPGIRAWAEVVNYDVDRTGTASDNDATYFMIGTQIAY